MKPELLAPQEILKDKNNYIYRMESHDWMFLYINIGVYPHILTKILQYVHI